MYKYYDRQYFVPVILDMSAVKEQDIPNILESLREFSPSELTYPSQYAVENAKYLASKGWPSLARPLPLNISSTEAVQIFARSLKSFNEFAAIRTEPNPSAVNKKVDSTADFERIVDELTLQQDGITLSHIFSTADLKSKVVWTRKQTPINAKLSKTVISVTKSMGKKSAEDKQSQLVAAILDGIRTAEEEEMVTFKKQPGKPFQYR